MLTIEFILPIGLPMLILAVSAFFFGYTVRITLSYVCLFIVLLLLAGPITISTWDPKLYQGDMYHFGRGVIILEIVTSAIFCFTGMALANSAIKIEPKLRFRHAYWLTISHIIFIFIIPITLLISLKRAIL